MYLILYDCLFCHPAFFHENASPSEVPMGPNDDDNINHDHNLINEEINLNERI